MSAKALMIPAAVWILAFGISQCETQRNMSSNFCDNIKTDNWQGLKKDVNGFLKTIKPEEGSETNFKKIADWIRTHDCVTNITVQPIEISTYPPIKQLTVELKNESSTISKTIGIRYTDKKYEIDIR
jgi:hypothetical protein